MNDTVDETPEMADESAQHAIGDAAQSAHADPRFHESLAALKAGNVQEAEAKVRAILADNPEDALSIHLLGVIAHQARRTDIGIDLVRKAVALQPETASFRNTLGFLLRVAKQPDAAIVELKKAIDVDPSYSEAYNNLGIAYADLGRLDEARSAYEQALKDREPIPEILNNLGNAYARMRNFDTAIAQYDAAVAARPNYAEAWSNRGDALFSKGKEHLAGAAESYEKALEFVPGFVDLWVKLGNCRQTENKLVEAEAAFRRALRIDPNHLRCLTAIAGVLERLGKLPAAASHMRQAVSVAPDDLAALKGLGHITLKLGNAVEAKHVLERARALAPADPDTLYSYANCLLRMEQLQPAMDLYLRVRELQPNQARGTFAPAAVLLMDGQYEKGFAAYESRYAMSAFKPNVPNIRERLWDGSPLDGRRLLVHVEQGFGDTLQFCRYLPKLREKLGTGGTIQFLCEKELYRVMTTLDGVDELHHVREPDLKIVYDVQIPLLSLPHRFGTGLQTIPADIPYLSVPVDAQRKEPLPTSDGSVLKVGIVWTGRPTHADNLYRSIPFKELATLFDVDGVDFHSLQVGSGADEIEAETARPNVFSHNGDLKDFADTAAVIAELDLVVTVDTAVCHLAGAMGKNVWTLVPYGGEWRWLRGREDTPWYPSMKLVRQRVLGDWGMVLDRVREGLAGVVEQRRAAAPVEPPPAPAKKAKTKKKS